MQRLSRFGKLAFFSLGVSLSSLAQAEVLAGSDSLACAVAQAGEGEPNVEVIWFPRAYSLNGSGSGHMGIRVDEKFYHLNTNGLHQDDFKSYMSQRLSLNHSAFGYALKATPLEKQKVVEFFQRQAGLNFNGYFQNCSQTACKALAHAGVTQLNTLECLDPLFAAQFFKHLDSFEHRTIYANATGAAQEVTVDNVLFRLEVTLGPAALLFGVFWLGRKMNRREPA